MGYVIRREQCPECASKGLDRSKNNLAVYNDESVYCWACGYSTLSEEYKMEYGLMEVVEVGMEFNEEIHNEIKNNTTFVEYRGITEKTAKYFGVRYLLNEDGEVEQSYYPTTKNYQISGYKIRQHPKKFLTPYGEVGKDCDMFGQFRFKTHSGICVICEGEIDQLSAFQMLESNNKNDRYDNIAVVSSTVGAKGTVKQVQENYDFFNQFSKCVLMLDNDKAGDEAKEELAQVLPKGKTYVVNLRRKDPNSYIWDKDKGIKIDAEQEFINDFWRMKPYTPGGVLGSSSLMEKIIESAEMPKIPLPAFMHKAQSIMAGGIPLSRIVNIGAASGAGKSTIADECVYFWVFNSPYRVGVVSLESDAGEYGLKLLSRHIGRKIDLIEDVEEKMEYLNSEFVVNKSRELFYDERGMDRFHLIDERDGGIKNLQKEVENLVLKCDCRVIILDPLQDVLDGCSNEEQAVFMKWQKGLVKSHKVTFININHIRKSGSGDEANSTGANIHEEDFSGSSTIFKSAACNMLFVRNKEATDVFERNTTYMKITKCRWTGRTDPEAGKYYYDNETHRLWDYDDYFKNTQQSHIPDVDF